MTVCGQGEVEADDHWIELVWAVDASGNVAHIAQFSATDDKAIINFTPTTKGPFTPFAFCNKHGVWQGQPIQL